MELETEDYVEKPVSPQEFLQKGLIEYSNKANNLALNAPNREV